MGRHLRLAFFLLFRGKPGMGPSSRLVSPVWCFPRCAQQPCWRSGRSGKKGTAIHVFYRQAHHRGERLSRHWHDLVRLEKAGIAAKALNDHALVLCLLSLPTKARRRSWERNAALPISLSGSLLLLVPFAVPTETLAGELTSGSGSAAVVVIKRLEELRKTVKPDKTDGLTGQSCLIRKGYPSTARNWSG